MRRSDGRERRFALSPMSVADFHRQVMAALTELDIAVSIYTRPVEVVEATAFEQDHAHASYDADTVNRIWRAFVQADRVFRSEEHTSELQSLMRITSDVFCFKKQKH